MPNWAITEIHMDNIHKMDLFTEINNKKEFDFNKLIPMPESCNLTSGTVTDYQTIAYLLKGKPGTFDDIIRASKENSLNHDMYQYIEGTYFKEHLLPTYNETDVKTRDEYYSIGKIIADNVRQYHARTWYDWACTNWGTKWNASYTRIKPNVVTITTAWDVPVPVLMELSRQHPDIPVVAISTTESKNDTIRLEFLNGKLAKSARM